MIITYIIRPVCHSHNLTGSQKYNNFSLQSESFFGGVLQIVSATSGLSPLNAQLF